MHTAGIHTPILIKALDFYLRRFSLLVPEFFFSSLCFWSSQFLMFVFPFSIPDLFFSFCLPLSFRGFFGSSISLLGFWACQDDGWILFSACLVTESQYVA
jgi:hypothetical protein